MSDERFKILLQQTNPFILAPLAGYTDLPLRLLCREYGAGLCYSEMISCHGLVLNQKSTRDLLQTVAAERPVVMQLFGSEPDIMAEAAAILAEQPIDAIDINMGCPVKKVTQKGAGAALLKNLDLASEIITKVSKASKLPVTIKTRIGWNHFSIVVVDFAKMAEESGAAAIAVHGRTWSDGFSGPIAFNEIANVKQAVTIPVIGNGEIRCHEDGLSMLRKTGCDAVMIGRAALDAPWIFSPTVNLSPSLHYRFNVLRRYLELAAEHLPTARILPRIQNQAGRFFKGIPNSIALRKRIYETKSFQALVDLAAASLS
ncbi:MAG: tRNA dihydrouridine synthase DusB [Deltaproteobacteria bacterium RIFOXYD12_FULL_50_9]|nr:MAG: tRNA dihydrouridine synthase DusB [Deltaproteobacteria bacterium RIFOXYD12_FULL_50_9]